MSAARAAVVSAALLAAPAAAQSPDVLLEQKLSRALAADPRLGRLTVSVLDRVAVVDGPVADPSAKQAADTLVRSVDGLAAVRLNVWVPLAADPFAERVREKLHPAPPPAPKPVPPPAGDLPPLALPFAPPPKPVAPEPVVAERQTDRRSWLAPPVVGSAGTIPPPDVPVVPPGRFARLTAGEPRFRRLTVRVDGTGTAVIAGEGDPAAGWELAAVLRHQPGVRRVVVCDIR